MRRDPLGMDDTEILERLRRLEREARPLEPGASRRRRLRDAVIASSERFLRRIETLKAFNDVQQPGIGLVDFPVSERGISIETAIDLVEREVVRPGGNTASGGHLAYIPGGGIYHAALGDYLAAVSNKYAGIFFAGPGPVRMENLLVRWVADLVGYPAGAAGNIASGGSIANLTAIATARDAHRLRGADYASAVGVPHHPGASLHREGAPDCRDGASRRSGRFRWTRDIGCDLRHWSRRSRPTGSGASARGS